MEKTFIFAGFGGQGMLLIGKFMAMSCMLDGKHVSWLPSYGPEMRGGTANCTVKYGPEKITNPGQQKPDLVLAMNTPSFKKFVGMVKPGGTILVNADMMTEDTNVRDDIQVISVHCNHLADSVQNAKGANIVMIGAITRILGDFTHDEGIEGMNDMFRKKGKSKFEAKNVAAFEAGYHALES